MTRVKICGITSLNDAEISLEAGAHALGFIFYRKSQRYIEPSDAAPIVESLGPFVTTVGVFVDETPMKVAEVVRVTGIGAIQLHGSENPAEFSGIPAKIIRGLRIRDTFDLRVLDKYRVNAFLLDTYVPGTAGGTGKTFDWNIARHAARTHRVILAGGLTPENVTDAINQVHPYAVDVASGVEIRPGVKDPERVRAFVRRVYQANE